MEVAQVGLVSIGRHAAQGGRPRSASMEIAYVALEEWGQQHHQLAITATHEAKSDALHVQAVIVMQTSDVEPDAD